MVILKILSFAAAVLVMTLVSAGADANGLKRMYVLDCGRLIAKDQSRWTPGVNAGQPRELWFRDKTLVSQLESLGVKPNDITYVAMSHSHADHTGNVNCSRSRRS